MTNDGRNALTDDAESRVRTNVHESLTTTCTYDAGALRVKKVAARTTTRYIFAGAKAIAEYENGAAPSSPAREYIYSSAALCACAGGQLVATHEGSALRYHHAEHLSVRATADTSGAKLGEQGHFPFGESGYTQETTSKMRFTLRLRSGQASYERDGESLNDDAIFRTHLSRLGRFNRPGPIAGSTDHRSRKIDRLASQPGSLANR